MVREFFRNVKNSKMPLYGGVSNGGISRSGLVLPFCPFWDFPDFPDFPDLLGDGPGIFPVRPFLFLGLLRAPTRNSPERVPDTIWTFPEKSGKPPGLETPRFSFSQQKFQNSKEKLQELQGQNLGTIADS